MTFGIRGNILRLELAKVTMDLIKSLDIKKIKYLVDDELARFVKKQAGKIIKADKTAKAAQLVKKSDFIVSIGGDGTFLATAKLVNSNGVPIIGVNLGKLGYLAETPVNKISQFISDIIKQKFRIEERTALEASSNVNGHTLHAMNEIVINQSGIIKTVFIQVFYNGSLVISYHADGLIVATPTGSTGYSLSAGGPITTPDTNVVILCPICPHTFSARPVILPDDGIILVKIEYKVPINVIADGNDSFILKKDASVEIKKAPYKIKTVIPINSNYFKILNRKLLWGEDKRILK
jgi:NAD+ kinase